MRRNPLWTFKQLRRTSTHEAQKIIESPESSKKLEIHENENNPLIIV